MVSCARTSSSSISFSITCRSFGENSVTSSRQAEKSCRAWTKSWGHDFYLFALKIQEMKHFCRCTAHLHWYAVESFGHEDVNQVFGQVVFDAQDDVDVVEGYFPLRKNNQNWVNLIEPMLDSFFNVTQMTLLLILQKGLSAMPCSSISVCLIRRGSSSRMSCCSSCPMFTLAEAGEGNGSQVTFSNGSERAPPWGESHRGCRRTRAEAWRWG